MIDKLIEDMQGYEVKGYKSMRGHGDGPPAWQATLYKNGVKVCSVQDDSWGGPLDVQVLNKPGFQYIQDEANKDKDGYFSVDIVIEQIVNAHLTLKSFITKCKTKMLIVTTKCKNDEYLAFKAPYSPALAAKVRTQYGDELMYIINEKV